MFRASTRIGRRAVLAAAFLAGGGVSRAVTMEPLLEPRMRLTTSPADRLSVALTFDACPGAFDWRIATALVEARVPSTIFVTGLWMRRNPAGLAFLLRHRDLFALENHGYWHIPPVLGDHRVFGIRAAGDVASITREVLAGGRVLQAADGIRPFWYRGATGFYSPEALDTIRDLGYRIAGYSLNGDMGATLSADTVERRIAHAVDGDIVVAHINQPHRSSGQGVVAGLMALRARGARFLRLDAIVRGDVIYG
jgi:peptidoglycan/xylan/chitin deacetylase (PgdA/CDA1 family)